MSSVEIASTPPTTESAAARGMVVGMIVGFFAVGGIALAMTLYAGGEMVSALGLAAFAGFWGGPGFGGMMGATLAATRAEEQHAAERRQAETSTAVSSPAPGAEAAPAA